MCHFVYVSLLRLRILVGAHAERQPAIRADLAAFLDFIRSLDLVDDREHDVRHVGLAVLRKGEHRLVRLLAELRAREREVARGIRSVQADRDGIQDARKLRCEHPAVLELAKPVRIDARGDIGMHSLDVAQERDQVFKSLRRLAEAAEDDFLHVFPWHAVELRLDLFDRRLPLQPER